jgi:alcohol dehydrogenase (cytochrome c)
MDVALQVPDRVVCLGTVGDVVFVGTPDGLFVALDARSGRQHWQFRTGTGIHSNPVTYSVSGRQYVAFRAGWADGSRALRRICLAGPAGPR